MMFTVLLFLMLFVLPVFAVCHRVILLVSSYWIMCVFVVVLFLLLSLVSIFWSFVQLCISSMVLIAGCLWVFVLRVLPG
ncbi:two-component system connector SafA [Escherichia coli]|uniref:two-component system connector SafA n=1 Tax=Escherichia coli TaxID=562 RepID=UPI003D9AD3A3